MTDQPEPLAPKDRQEQPAQQALPEQMERDCVNEGITMTPKVTTLTMSSLAVEQPTSPSPRYHSATLIRRMTSAAMAVTGVS